MRKSLQRTASAASKVGKVVVSGALAAALLPGVALAADDGDGASLEAESTEVGSTYAIQDGDQSKSMNLDLASTEYTYTDEETGEEVTEIIWSDGEWTTYDEENGIYVWSTYVKGDGSHYGHYSVDFTFEVDEDGVLQSVDLSSTGNTFGGVWGNITTKSGNITGYLPSGVENTTSTATDSDGYLVVTPSLSGADVYGGYTISAATLYQVNSEGGIYELDSDGNIVYEEVYDESDGDTDSEPVALGSASVTLTDGTATDDYSYDDGAITVYNTSTVDGEDGYGVLCVSYTIGDYYTFDQYVALNDNGQLYEITDTDFWAEPSGIGAKNRDQYSSTAFVTIFQRELTSYLNGDTDDIDTISGCTKSSYAMVEALYAALGYYYPITNKLEYTAITAEGGAWDAIFTSVSSSLDLTVDENPGDSYVPEDGAREGNDVTSVTKDSDGNYVLTLGLVAGSDTLLASAVAFYDYDDTALNSAELVELGYGSAAVINGYDTYAGYDEFLGGYITSNSASHGFVGELESCTVYADDGTELGVYDADAGTLTVTNSEVTHVAIGYAVAKKSEYSERSGVMGYAYSLEELYQTSLAQKKIDAALELGSYANYAKALSAYAALSADAKTFVDAESYAELVSAAEASDISNATVKLSKTSYTYNGSARKPGVTVTLDGTTLTKGEDYTVSYSNNTKAGTAKVTITGAGEYGGSATATFTIKKASQTLKVTTAKVTAKSSKKTTGLKGIKKVSGAKGTVSYKKTSGNSKISVNAKTGKITVKKGLKKGTYTVKIKVTSKATANYKAATKTVSVKVKVK